MTLAELLSQIEGGLVVSCQAAATSPLRDSDALARVARAAVAGGAAAIRCGGVGGVHDITTIAGQVQVPVIGLTKEGSDGVYITPTVRAALAVLEAGAQVVAADGTRRPRPDGAPFSETARAVHEAGGLLLADISNLAEGLAAAEDGADLVATTLSGYVPGGGAEVGPDLELVRDLVRKLAQSVPVVAEGRYHSPDAARRAIDLGAIAVVVGTAITDPIWITAAFASRLRADDRTATC